MGDGVVCRRGDSKRGILLYGLGDLGLLESSLCLTGESYRRGKGDRFSSILWGDGEGVLRGMLLYGDGERGI